MSDRLLQAFAPLAQPDAQILVLGSMPGVASLNVQQYYAHPRNAFWPIISSVLGQNPGTYRQRVALLLANQIAVWDVLQECQRPGSLDSNIQADSIRCNDFASFFSQHSLIRRVLFNGKTAEKLFRKHVSKTIEDQSSVRFYALPSTSPAMASLTLAEKTQLWEKALLIRASL